MTKGSRFGTINCPNHSRKTKKKKIQKQPRTEKPKTGKEKEKKGGSETNYNSQVGAWEPGYLGLICER